MSDALHRAAQDGNPFAPVVDWKNAFQSLMVFIPREVAISEIIDVVRELRAANLAVILQCEECGKDLPPTLRQKNHCKTCKECREAKKQQSWREDRREKQEKESALWKNGRGSDAFKFYYMCSHFNLDKAHLKAMPYQDFMGTLYWNVVRNYVVYRQGRKCALCASTTNLNVHHKTYEHHGEEHNHLEDLIVICRSCHSKFHDKFDKRDEVAA